MNGASTRSGNLSGETDWDRLRAMTDEEAEANALADPDVPSITEARLKMLEPVSRVKLLRGSLRLGQGEFAERYAVPLETLREWETGKAKPERAVLSYLCVIAQEPEMTARALQAAIKAA